jgi:hypothetical protein
MDSTTIYNQTVFTPPPGFVNVPSVDSAARRHHIVEIGDVSSATEANDRTLNNTKLATGCERFPPQNVP